MSRLMPALLLLPLFWSGCESTPDGKKERDDDADQIVIPKKDLEPLQTFLTQGKVIIADFVRIRMSTQYFHERTGMTRDPRYVERKIRVSKNGERVIILRNVNKVQRTNVDPDLLPRVTLGEGIRINAFNEIRIYLKDAQTRERPLFLFIDAKSPRGGAKMWSNGRLVMEKNVIRIQAQMVWDPEFEFYRFRPNVE